MNEANSWLFYESGKQLVQQKLKLPKPGVGEVLVKNTACTICKSDLHTFTGARSGPVPSILGHEIVGNIVETGGQVFDYFGELLRPGDLVTWSLVVSCGKCRNCKNGIPQKCLSLKKYGHEKTEGHFQLTGGFASHTHLYPGTAIYKLPDNLPVSLLASLNCSWATVAAALRLAGDVKGKNVLVTGAGMLGIITLMMCKEYGAKQILVIEKNTDRLKLAGEFGADLFLPSGSESNEVKKEIIEFLDGEPVDLIFEMTGSNQAVKLGLDVAGVGSVIIMAGSVFPTEDVQINPERIVRNLLQIKGVHNYTPGDLASAIHFMHRIYSRYPLEKLFDFQVFRLEKINEGVSHVLTSSKQRVVIKI